MLSSNQVAALDPRANSAINMGCAAKEESKEIVRELDLASGQANMLRNEIEELYSRLQVVMHPDAPETVNPVSTSMPPSELQQTQIGQRINAVTTLLQSTTFVVRDIMRRLELQ